MRIRRSWPSRVTDRAEPLHKGELTIREKALAPDQADVSNSLNNLAALYHVQGHYAEAVPLARRSMAAYTKRRLLPEETADEGRLAFQELVAVALCARVWIETAKSGTTNTVPTLSQTLSSQFYPEWWQFGAPEEFRTLALISIVKRMSALGQKRPPPLTFAQ